MKKFIALVALVLVSASTMMYAQESNAAARRAERKAQRDAERAKLRAEEEVQDMAAYQQAVQALKNKQFVLEANQVVFRNGIECFCYFKHQLRPDERQQSYRTDCFQHSLPRS